MPTSFGVPLVLHSHTIYSSNFRLDQLTFVKTSDVTYISFTYININFLFIIGLMKNKRKPTIQRQLIRDKIRLVETIK